MKSIRLLADDPLHFEDQLRIADSIARTLLNEPMLLSWYDAARGIESPNGVSECGKAAPTDGVRAYAKARGGRLAVVFGSSIAEDTSFCFSEVGDL